MSSPQDPGRTDQASVAADRSSPGAPSPALDTALDRAAAILRKARLPVVAGLGTDADGIRAALALAERLGGAIDHAGGDVAAGEMRVLADAGLMATTPAEARHRADLVVLVGAAAAAWAVEIGLFDDARPLYPWRRERSVLFVGLGADRPPELGRLTTSVTTLGDDAADPRRLLAGLRAAVGARAVAAAPGTPSPADFAAAAATLKSAAFGVVVYDPATLGALGIETAQGLVKDLNAATRFSSLAIPSRIGGRVAQVVSAWTTGFPLRTGFGRGYPDYDPWRFSAERLLAAGEADALLWVAPLGPDLPAWAPRDRTVALVAPGASADAAVTIEVGVPGVDHGATLYEARRDGFAWRPASMPSGRPTAASLLIRLAEACARGVAA